MFSQIRRLLIGTRVRRNLLTSGGANLFSAAVGLAFYPLALHFLGYQLYGVWLAVSIVITLAQLGGIGLGPAVTNHVAEAVGRKTEREITVALSCSYVLTVPLAALVGLLVNLSGPALVSVLALESERAAVAAEIMPWMAALSGYMVIAQLSPAALLGIGRADLASAVASCGRAGFLLTAGLLMLAGWKLEAVIAAHAVESVFTHLVSGWLLRRQVLIESFETAHLDVETIKRLVFFGSRVVGTNVMQLMLTPLNRVLLSRFAGIDSIPIFEIAWGSALRIRSFLDSAFKALIPELTRSFAEGNRERLRGLLSRANRLAFYAGFPLHLLPTLVAPLALQLLLSDNFRPEVVPCFRLLALGSFVSLLAVPAHHHLLAIGCVNGMFIGHFILTVSNAVSALGLAYVGWLTPTTLCGSLMVGLILSSVWFVVASRSALRA